jgi:hypothetical protein
MTIYLVYDRKTFDQISGVSSAFPVDHLFLAVPN